MTTHPNRTICGHDGCVAGQPCKVWHTINPRTMVSIDVADAITDTYAELGAYVEARHYDVNGEWDRAFERLDRWSCEVNLMARDYDAGSIDHAVLNTLALLSERVMLGGE